MTDQKHTFLSVNGKTYVVHTVGGRTHIDVKVRRPATFKRAPITTWRGINPGPTFDRVFAAARHA